MHSREIDNQIIGSDARFNSLFTLQPLRSLRDALGCDVRCANAEVLVAEDLVVYAFVKVALAEPLEDGAGFCKFLRLKVRVTSSMRTGKID